MPAAPAEVVSDFADVTGQDKLALLLEFANELPPLPADLEEAAMEPVPECQSPLFLHVDAADPDHVRLHFSAPRRPRPPAVSPRSWPPAWTASPPPQSWPFRTISTPIWGWPR